MFIISRRVCVLLDVATVFQRPFTMSQPTPTCRTVPEITLNNNRKCPALGMGTWLAKPGEVGESVKYSIDIGYRLFDCAWIYGNEKEIGQGFAAKLADGTVKREELFITTKLWNTFHEQEVVVPTIKESLKNLGLDYLDLYLIHWPCAQKNIGAFDGEKPFDNVINVAYDFVQTWKGMEECVRLGLTKCIGVSNFNKKQLQRILDNATIKPVVNEIEVNPLLNNKELIKFCKERDIQIFAYSPLASPARTWKQPGDPTLDINDPKLVNIAKKYKKNPGQIILRYVHQLGTIPIPKSSNKCRINQNFNVFDFQLTNEEMATIDTFNCNGRVCPADPLRDNVDYPFKDE